MTEVCKDPAPADLRDRFLDVAADMESDFGRRHSALVRRVESLERRAAVLSLPEEVKAMLLMIGLSVSATVVVSLMQVVLDKWRRSQ